MVSVFGPCCGIFRVAECPLGGEICGVSFRHLPPVVFYLAGISGVFIALRSSRSRRLPSGGAYTDCAEQWSPGILSRPPSRKVGGNEAGVCSVCSSIAVGACRPSWLGGTASADLCRGSATRSIPTREKRSYMHHSIHTESAPLTYALRTTASRARHATAHVASLAHNSRRYVNELINEVCE